VKISEASAFCGVCVWWCNWKYKWDFCGPVNISHGMPFQLIDPPVHVLNYAVMRLVYSWSKCLAYRPPLIMSMSTLITRPATHRISTCAVRVRAAFINCFGISSISYRAFCFLLAICWVMWKYLFKLAENFLNF
jgi:hypothetical protein